MPRKRKSPINDFRDSPQIKPEPQHNPTIPPATTPSPSPLTVDLPDTTDTVHSFNETLETRLFREERRKPIYENEGDGYWIVRDRQFEDESSEDSSSALTDLSGSGSILSSDDTRSKKRKRPKDANSNDLMADATLDSSPSTKRTARKAKSKARPESPLYVFEEVSEEEENDIPQAEREDLVYELTRERAARMAEAVKVPENSRMGRGEQSLYLGLALRGCKPVMSGHWQKDFSTLPESLFTTLESENKEEIVDEESIIFKPLRRSDFYAIKAFQELLSIGGRVRDCRLLTVQPQIVMQKAIRKYMRWAIDDACLKTSPTTIPVHAIYTQKPGEETLTTIVRMTKKLERLAKRYQTAHDDSESPYWPTLVGFVLCGPIISLVSLDSDPKAAAWTEPSDTPVKYLGQFDMTEPAQDVWNSLAIAISVIHARETMAQLAHAYTGPRFPRFRSQDDDTEDEDS
ncbi:uncharacterized protein N7459_003109 [Penicillium hispanicum]|uniref:uncharacterized protein n=1 Tax=Penicillium hispanicum TaxID=1080232 RepID=UPI0025417931|nr:uncharacterized protein N7459_003109 [Penicillium hispanicum]KAJ5587344.1 hypothetical protein N7459_003109 [Penicillium hispanicum]